MKQTIIWTDCGDTIIDEGTQLFDDEGIVLQAACIENAADVYQQLYHLGYRMALVADGRGKSFQNLLEQHELSSLFDVTVISETVGSEKPNARMFQQALGEMGLDEADKFRIVMIGNNLERDVRGANEFGVTSIWLDWSESERYKKQPETSSEQPDYTIHHPAELVALLASFEENLN